MKICPFCQTGLFQFFEGTNIAFLVRFALLPNLFPFQVWFEGPKSEERNKGSPLEIT